MAQYHIKADELKPLVQQANFNTQQLNIILKMMRGCTQLRQGKVINSFFGLMLPSGFKMQEGQEIEGQYGTYRPIEIIQELTA